MTLSLKKYTVLVNSIRLYFVSPYSVSHKSFVYDNLKKEKKPVPLFSLKCIVFLSQSPLINNFQV